MKTAEQWARESPCGGRHAGDVEYVREIQADALRSQRKRMTVFIPPSMRGPFNWIMDDIECEADKIERVDK